MEQNDKGKVLLIKINPFIEPIPLQSNPFFKTSFRIASSPVCVDSQNMTYISSCVAECQEKVAKNITQTIDFNWLFMFNCNDELINWHLFKGRLIKFVPENVNILNSDLSTYLSFFLQYFICIYLGQSQLFEQCSWQQ